MFTDQTDSNVEKTLQYINEVMTQAKVEKPEWPKNHQEENLQTIIDKMCDNNHRFAVEFECGACCKKIKNIAKVFILGDVAILLPVPCESLILKVISWGKVVEKSLLRTAIVPLEKLCAFEVERARA